LIGNERRPEGRLFVNGRDYPPTGFIRTASDKWHFLCYGKTGLGKPGSAKNGGFMKFSAIKRLLRRPAVWLAGVAIVTMAVGATSDALARRGKKAHASVAALALAPQQKPVRLRYYGGPKSPMYPE
jgi:hypothetical protein